MSQRSGFASRPAAVLTFTHPTFSRFFETMSSSPIFSVAARSISASSKKREHRALILCAKPLSPKVAHGYMAP